MPERCFPRAARAIAAVALTLAASLTLSCSDGTPTTPPTVGSGSAVGTTTSGHHMSIVEDGRGVVFASETFVREAGKPVVIERSVETNGFLPPFRLHVVNGTSDGFNRVDAASVVIDGIEVLGTHNFNETVEGYSFEVEIGDPGLLQVQLEGAPGDQFSIHIDGVLQRQAEVGSQGGTAVFEGGKVAVAVPPNTVDDGTTLTAEPVDDDSEPPPSGTEPLTGTRIELGPDGTTFDEPVTVTIAVDPAILPANVVPEDLRVFTFVDGIWVPLADGFYDPVTGTAAGKTTHFSEFAVLTLARVCPGEPEPSKSTLQEAYDALVAGGAIEICGGTHDVDSLSVAKPMTVGPVEGTAPVIRTTLARAGFIVEGVPSGTVLFRDLAFESSVRTSIMARGAYDQVVVENTSFAIGAQSGVEANRRNIVTGRVEVRNSGFTGGSVGTFALNGGSIDVFGSTFGEHTFSGVHFQGGSSGLVQGNTIGPGCGPNGCVRISQPGTSVTVVGNQIVENRTTDEGPAASSVMVVTGAFGRIEDNDFDGCGATACVFGTNGAVVEAVNNRITAVAEQRTFFGIVGTSCPDASAPASVLATDNVITAVGAAADGEYPIIHSGIQAECGSEVRARRNQVSGAGAGISAWNGGIMEESTNNVISGVRTGFGIWEPGSRLNGSENDVTGYELAIDFNADDPTRTNLQCNWWGDPLGPTNVNGIPSSRYTPWSNAPVAGAGSSNCEGGPLAYAIVNPADFSDPAAFETLAEALAAVSDGGEIAIADGTYTVQDFAIQKAVWIHALGPGRPVIDAAGANHAFVLQASAGLVTLQGLEVQGAVDHTILIGQADQVVIEDVVIHPPDPATGNQFGGGVFAFEVQSPGGIFIRNSQFLGGAVGVHMNNTSNVIVENNHFEKQEWSAIQGPVGAVQDNTVHGCLNPGGCMALSGYQGQPFEVRGNYIRIDLAEPDQPSMGQVVSIESSDAVTFENNTIEGIGGTQEPNNTGTWPIQFQAVHAQNRSITFSNNTIGGAFGGLGVAAGVESVTGQDNTFQQLWIPIRDYESDGTVVSIHSSDFVSYGNPYEGEDLKVAGTLTCNWWGSTAGPQVHPEAFFDGLDDAHTPWATGPVAGTSSTMCDGSPLAYAIVNPADFSDPAAFETLAEALAAVSDGGEIAMADGTYTVQDFAIQKPVWIHALGPGRPVIDASGANHAFVLQASSGLVTLQGLEVQGAVDHTILIGQADQVVIEDVVIHPPDPATGHQFGGGVSAFGVQSPGGIFIRNSQFLGGAVGVHMNNTSNVIVENNHFEKQLVQAVQGPVAAVNDNNVVGCLGGACMGLEGYQGQPFTVARNQVVLDLSDPDQGPVNHVIALNSSDAVTVEDNIISGFGSPMEPNNTETWPVRFQAILVGNRSVTLERNLVDGAFSAVGIAPGVESVSGQDNTFQQVWIGISDHMPDGTAVSLHSNDFVNYGNPYEGEDLKVAGTLTCNWWGSTAGPQVHPEAFFDGLDDAHTPWATGPVAGTSSTTCDGGDGGDGGGALTFVRVDPATADGDPATFATMADAVFNVEPGGTVAIADGTHVAQNIPVNKAVTIESEGPGTPVIDGAGDVRSLRVHDTGAGMVTVRGLRFEGTTDASIVVTQQVDQILIESSVFHGVAPGGAGVHLSFPSANQVTIQGNSFEGGASGVTSSSAPNLFILNNDFGPGSRVSGQAVAVEGNRFTDCAPTSCMAVQGEAGPGIAVRGNQITIQSVDPLVDQVNLAINVGVSSGGTATVDGNSILAVGGTMQFFDQDTWPLMSGISVSGEGVLTNNTVSGAFFGLSLSHVSAATVTDNVVDQARTALLDVSDDGTSPSVHSNDFSNYTEAYSGADLNVAGVLTCNWWGSVDGPVGLISGALPDAYTPWATAPVAGTSTTSCSGGLP